jgi:predicted O-methyltransferase YrrM
MTKTKKYLLKIINPFISLLRVSINNSISSSLINPSAIDLLYSRAQERYATYIETQKNIVMIFPKRYDLWDYVLKQKTINGIFAEFGVASGRSINYFSKHLPKNEKIYGFDSFEGLKEDFIGTFYSKGAFSQNSKLPKVNSNVVLVKGWFSETIPNFIKHDSRNFAFIHADADTYESTFEFFSLIIDKITSGTIIIFDEYGGYPFWESNEYRAWSEIVLKNQIKYQYIAFGPLCAALKVV